LKLGLAGDTMLGRRVGDLEPCAGWSRRPSNYPLVDERSERIARRFDLPMLIAALLVVPVVAVEQSSLGEPWRVVASVLNWLIWIAFAAELVVMLTVVPDRWRWLRAHPLEVFIVVVTPPFVPSGLAGARALRLLRLLRVLRLASLARRAFSLAGLRYVALLAALTVLVGGAAFAAVEPHNTTWDGVYWAITTMTTVGYGGPPSTTLGEILSVGVLAVGIGFVAVLTGAVAQRFLAAEVEEVLEATDQVEATDVELIEELREVRNRIERLEARLARRPT
jgi:voltage-gated potassium channel